MLVDSHCHLTLLGPADPERVAAVLDRAEAQGVRRCLCVSVDLDGFPEILEISRRDARVYASVGVHPNTECASEPEAARLLELAQDPAVIAIGETGLDYYRQSGDLEWQRERLRMHIAVAKAARMPLIIHCREAAPDVLRILKEEAAEAVGGVMHCFVDDWDTAVRAMDMNFYISFSGIVTFRNAAQVQEVAKRVPLERLLVETDSPYLAPVPHRGKPNEPAHVRLVAEHIAALRGIPASQLFTATTANFYALFGRSSRRSASTAALDHQGLGP